MKIFTELTWLAGRSSAAVLRERVNALEGAGSSGISVWDHIFGDDKALQPCDPLTTLGAIAGMSDQLELQTIVMNAAWIHPGLLLRQFSQLAVLCGGDRVTAGLGAGWSSEEFRALGLEFPPFAARAGRLEDVVAIAHQLFNSSRTADVDGRYFKAVDLPNSPRSDTPPRLLVGGGGDRTLGLAARFADKIDIIASPKVDSGVKNPKTMHDQHNRLQGARGFTVLSDLQERVGALRALTVAAGRPVDAVKICVQVNYAILCSGRAQVEQTDRLICRDWFHIPYQPLDDNPYILRGEPQEIADTIAERERRLGLYQITIQENQDSVAFCERVVPLLH